MNITKETTVKEIIGEDKFDKFIEYFGYLYGRWQDEKEYEDFQDYIDAVEDRIGLPIDKMTKRPFQVNFYASDTWSAYFKATSRQVEWGLIKKANKG